MKKFVKIAPALGDVGVRRWGLGDLPWLGEGLDGDRSK